MIVSASIGIGANNSNGQGAASSSNPNQQNNFYPKGSTTISAQNSGYKKEQTTFATIGLGDITTNATLTFDADGNLTCKNPPRCLHLQKLQKEFHANLRGGVFGVFVEIFQ